MKRVVNCRCIQRVVLSAIGWIDWVRALVRGRAALSPPTLPTHAAGLLAAAPSRWASSGARLRGAHPAATSLAPFSLLAHSPAASQVVLANSLIALVSVQWIFGLAPVYVTAPYGVVASGLVHAFGIYLLLNILFNYWGCLLPRPGFPGAAQCPVCRGGGRIGCLNCLGERYV